MPELRRTRTIMALKIYISSTYGDLVDHREVVYRRLRSLRHDVVAMEDYVATDRRPLDECLRDVGDCDVYVGIFAWRYGFVPTEDNPLGASITELEYLEAVKREKPCLIFVLKDDVPWPPTDMDARTGENDKGRRIEALRARLMDDRLVSLFETPDELAAMVVSALYRWETEASVAAAGAVPPPAPAPPGVPALAREDAPLLWAPGSVLRVRFLDGDDVLRQRVVRLARIWMAYANIGFVESTDADAEVRVDFRKGWGSWAYEGTNTLTVAHDQPTLNLGWVSADSPVADMESVVLHEFGHVLGLAHEHNNPHGEIPWDRDAVYEAYTTPPYNWPRARVDGTIFSTWDEARFPFRKPFDPLSIMANTFPAALTQGEQLFGRNVAVSSGDKEFISRLYPYPVG